MHDLAALLGPTKTASDAVLAHEASPRSLERWLASGRLVRIHPGWVTLPEWAEDWTVRAHAATGYTGGTLSHTSALRAHGLVDRGCSQLHVTVPPNDRLRSSRRLRIHRSRRPCGVLIVDGLATTSVERALVDTWGDAHVGRRSPRYVDLARNSVLRAVRERRVTVTELDQELPSVPRLPGRDGLLELMEEVREGVHSYLERLGLRALLTAGLPRPVLQYEIRLGLGSLHVDAAWPEVKLAVEFDGAAFHAGQKDWQRDLRRDAALAAAGWVVLPFSFADITQRPAFCGAQVAAAYRERRLDVPQPAVRGAKMAAPGTS